MTAVLTSSSGHAHPAHALWNPSAAANWSILFTPAFGSYVQMLNWQELGESERAAQSRKWFYASLLMLVVYAVVPVFLGMHEAAEFGLKLLVVAYLATWYFASGRTQITYLRNQFADEYPHKRWGKPLLYAAGAVLALFSANLLIGVLAGLARAITGA